LVENYQKVVSKGRKWEVLLETTELGDSWKKEKVVQEEKRQIGKVYARSRTVTKPISAKDQRSWLQ